MKLKLNANKTKAWIVVPYYDKKSPIKYNCNNIFKRVNIGRTFYALETKDHNVFQE